MFVVGINTTTEYVWCKCESCELYPVTALVTFFEDGRYETYAVCLGCAAAADLLSTVR